jgi:hypothetical protein
VVAYPSRTSAGAHVSPLHAFRLPPTVSLSRFFPCCDAISVASPAPLGSCTSVTDRSAHSASSRYLRAYAAGPRPLPPDPPGSCLPRDSP